MRHLKFVIDFLLLLFSKPLYNTLSDPGRDTKPLQNVLLFTLAYFHKSILKMMIALKPEMSTN